MPANSPASIFASRPVPIAILALSLFTQSYASAQTPHQSLLVLSKHDHTLSIVDPATLKVVGKAPVGEDPHEVVASADGKTAYVSIYGGGQYHKLNVIDLIAQKPLEDIDTGALNGPHGLDFQGGKVWFTAEGAKAIASYDPATQKIDWIMGTGQNRTHMIYVTPDPKHIYTTNVNAATVSLWEQTPQVLRPPPARPGQNGPGGPPPGMPPGVGGPPRLEWNQTVVSVGPGDEGFDVSPDGKELWTANAHDGTLSIVDLASRKNVATLPAKAFGANRLKFSRDGKLVLISLLGDTDLVIYNAATRKEFKRVKIGHGAAGILIQPDGAKAYISCGPDNYVAVLDMKTLEIVGHIEAGVEPDGLAWAVQQ
jgi:YVTN family beta-propeller protein